MNHDEGEVNELKMYGNESGNVRSEQMSIETSSNKSHEPKDLNKKKQMGAQAPLHLLQGEEEGDEEENKENDSDRNFSKLQIDLHNSIVTFEGKMKRRMRQEEELLKRWEDLSGDFRSHRMRWSRMFHNAKPVKE